MKTVVYGLGISALSVLKKIKNLDDDVYVINKGSVDSWQQKVKFISRDFKCVSEEESYRTLSICDRVILSPGIPRSINWLEHVCPSKVISEIEFAYLNSKVPVIAVTGSNGKTTTSTMIYQALKSFGKKVFLGGNIGVPYSDIVGEDYDYAVIELSSFQLESINRFCPIVSIITNLTPNHMERYNTFDDYKLAKFNIFKNQNNGLLLASEKYVNNKNIKFSQIEMIKTFDLSETKAIGEHNRYNFFCANEVCKFLCENYKKDTFQDFMNSFKSPKYRLEFIAKICDLSFYNDSKSTNLESTIKAVESFSDNRILILGGKLRSDDVKEFEALKKYEFTSIFAFGESASLISHTLSCDIFSDLDTIFKELQNIKLGNIIFSPGFPSFDQYKNFEDRGEHFNQLVADFRA